MPKSESESWAILDFGWSYVTRNLKEKKKKKKEDPGYQTMEKEIQFLIKGRKYPYIVKADF